MDTNQIYDILTSKPHNHHYIKRYFNYINACRIKNISNTSEYTEEHHICPKADDMFPEYNNLKTYSWNAVNLTTKQHLIAHVMLSLIYGGSQSIALHFFLSVNGEGSLGQRRIPTCVQIRYATKARQEFIDWRRGKSTYKDSTGNKFFIRTDDPIIQELGLVGNNFGHTHTEESKQLMSDAKYPNKTVPLFFLDNITWVRLFSEEFSDFINQGWSTIKTVDDYKYCQTLGNALVAKYWTGRSRYATPDGIYHGAYLHTDPIIQSLELIQYRSQAQIDQNASRTVLASEARTGSNIYNNGVEEKFLFEPTDDTWVLGRLPRNGDWESKRKDAVNAKVVGAKTYTNGKINMFILPNDTVPVGFWLGMKHRENTIYTYVSEETKTIIEFKGLHTPPTEMTRILGVEKINSYKRRFGL
jgi:hypothetical protein